MEHELRVPVGLEEKVVQISVDPESGRAAIRVDGKMAAKPLAPEEESREIVLGSDRYEIRRAWDAFEIEFLGRIETEQIVMNPPAVGRHTEARANGAAVSPSPGRKKVALITVIVLLLGGTLLFGVPLYTSAVSGWETFENPDGSFSVSLPGEPKKEKEFVMIPGGATYTHTLMLARGSYEYAISYFSLPRGYDHSADGEMVVAMRQFILQDYHGEVLEESTTGRSAWMRVRIRDHETASNKVLSGDLHVEIRVTDDRVYIIGVAAPIDRLDSAPARRFLYSFRIKGQPIMDIPEWVKL